MSNEYTCAKCGGVFQKGWSDEEARAEQIANGFGDLAPEDEAIICDDCYNKIMARIYSQSAKETAK